MTLPYPTLVGRGMLRRLPDVVRDAGRGNRIALISDTNVARRYGARVAKQLKLGAADRFTIPAGEKHKTRATWAKLTDQLLKRGFGRDTTVVALGGGVVGDIAGFVAATYMRGVPVVQVPTTLLAMVDASVGGKTGVDTPAGKNLVGAFHQPAAVLADTDVLATLPLDHVRAGFAEIVKHGVIGDAEYFAAVSDMMARWPKKGALPDIAQIVEWSIWIKADVVSRDERESGLRKVLNFGHTIAHAVESAMRFKMLHGHAVAVGMVAEARIAEHLGVAKPGLRESIERVCGHAGLPTKLPRVQLASLIKLTHSDKKVRAGHVEYALPRKIGEMAGGDSGWAIRVDDAVVRAALSA